MEFLHYPLRTKKQINKVIRYTEDKVVVIRFGRASDPICMQQDYIVKILYIYIFNFIYIKKKIIFEK